MIRKIAAALLYACLFLLRPVPVAASFHLMKIVEVFPGTATEPAAQYVMLQMYFSGQNLVAGHTVTVFDASGAMLGTFTFESKVGKGNNLATVLIATADAETLFGITADLQMLPVIPAGGGAVCYDVIDCVAWGNFSAPNALPVSPGTAFNASAGLLPGMAMHRNLSAGGAVTPFVFAPPAPKNNMGQTGMLSATPTVISTATPTSTPTVPAGVCAGDCDGDGNVHVSEVITLVNIVLDAAEPSACADGIPLSAPVDIAFIVQAVNNALGSCGGG